MTEQRRLAAILVADVVGYSKLMGSDEAGTLAELEALRTEIIEPQIAKHAGRLFKSVGDGFLMEFASAVQAVSCAKAIQEANDLGRLPLRIGIHVGDVVVQGDDLLGDGVNVAARLEGIATPGGIAISRACMSRCATGSISASSTRARSSSRTSLDRCRSGVVGQAATARPPALRRQHSRYPTSRRSRCCRSRT